MNNKPSQILIHIAGCGLFLLLPFLFSPDRHQGFFSVIKNPGYYSDLLRYVMMLLFFYLNYYFLIPGLYFSEKYLVYFLLVLVCFFIISYVPQLFDLNRGRRIPFPPHPINSIPGKQMPGERPGGDLFSMRQNIFLFLALFFFSLMLRISNRWRRVEKEKVDRELSYLKAQINPHFLFNTLNSIYALAINKSDDTAAAVVKLSGMMRYVLSDATLEYVPLEKEINYIRDYIELQELRFGESMQLDFTVKGELHSQKIAPLILIAFVENAFKYGVNAEEEAPISIAIHIFNAVLTMKVHNYKVKRDGDTDNQHGLGIANTKNRLELLYPSRHMLEIKNTERDFTVLLTLNL
ncbi:MAG: histidine kinase [Chitinophagaceae bacterium]|nr:histidine kinase [Chitinophagaceae bacterium]